MYLLLLYEALVFSSVNYVDRHSITILRSEYYMHTFFCDNTVLNFPVTARSPLEKTRYETSLGLLTKKFVSLFHSSSSGTVDLNKVR